MAAAYLRRRGCRQGDPNVGVLSGLFAKSLAYALSSVELWTSEDLP
jgi:hypothetical protein